MDEKIKKVLSSFEAKCARQEYCTSEVLLKVVKALEGDKTSAQEVLDSLVKDGYVDDTRYAAAFARDKASLSGWGPVKIRFLLRAKGLDDNTINSALDSVEQDKAEDRMERLMRAKWKTLQADPQARLKLLKYTLGRGYEYDSVSAALERICRNG